MTDDANLGWLVTVGGVTGAVVFGGLIYADQLLSPVWGFAVGAIATLLTRIIYLRRNKDRLAPRGYKPFVATKVYDRPQEIPCNRDAFKTRKIPDDLDAIVIGSGISGLYLGACLGRIGKRVLVLEQHYVAGGCTHVFEDHKYEFDTGLHYVGKATKYSHMLNLVTVGEKVDFIKLGTEENGYAYDEIHLPGCKPHVYRAGVDRTFHDLATRFPTYKDRIKRYLDLCEKANSSADPYVFGRLFSPLMRWVLHTFASTKFFDLAGKTLDEVLDELEIDNPELRAILAGNFGDYGLPPKKSSFFIHAGVVSHYMREGGFYPRGGPGKIALALIPTIEAAGGRVLVRARVKDIVVDPKTKQALGVIMEDGTDIRVKVGGCVVSSIGCQGTSALLTNAKRLGAAPPRLVWETAPDKLGPGVSHMYAFIGLRGTKDELELRDSNIWSLPCGKDSFDLNKMCDDYYENPHENDEKLLLFMGFPSAKDPDWEKHNPGISTCCIITEAKSEWFQGFMDGKSGSRSEEYEVLKNKWKHRFLNGLYQYYPKCKGRVEYVSLASPLTNQFYLGRSDSYGFDPSPERFVSHYMRRFSPRDDVIKGLFHTGQDTLTAGVFGALMSGFVTAHAVLGYDWADMLTADRHLVQGLENLNNEEKKKH